jgi:carboxymethylenebutenolidase
MRGQDINFPSNGTSAPGYLARPDTDDPRPGIVVIQEWWGLDAHIRDVAGRFAESGFVALAPDLYHGVVTPEPDEARKLAMSLDRARAIKEIGAAAAYLKAQSFVMPKKIGVVGFCMGGGLTLHSAARFDDFGAAVAFYGGMPPSADEFANRYLALLNIVGDQDGALPGLRALDEGLKRYNFPHEMIVYPNAPHAFFNDTRPHIYKADAAQDAWKQATRWFEKYLKN